MIEHPEINMVSLLEKYCNKKTKNMGMVKKEKKKEPVIPII